MRSGPRNSLSRRQPIDQEFVRRLALALPETDEQAHFGRRDFRVRNKIFATLPEDGRSVNLRATPVTLDALVSAEPATFTGILGRRWIGVDLSTVQQTVLRDLITGAWRLTAPKRLVAALDQGRDLSRA